MCACLAPKWAGLVGRSAALCHEEGGGGRGAALRWLLTDPWKKAERGAEKNSIDVQLFPTRRSPAVLNIVRAASLSVRRFHLARHLCRWGGGRGGGEEREHMRWNDVDPGQLWCFFVDSWSHLQKQTALFFSYRHKTRHAHPHTHSEPQVLKELKR